MDPGDGDHVDAGDGENACTDDGVSVTDGKQNDGSVSDGGRSDAPVEAIARFDIVFSMPVTFVSDLVASVRTDDFRTWVMAFAERALASVLLSPEAEILPPVATGGFVWRLRLLCRADCCGGADHLSWPLHTALLTEMLNSCG